jgi:hypothetical protein
MQMDRLGQIATAATVTVMFGVVLFAVPVLHAFASTWHVKAVMTVAAGLGSPCIYKLIASTLLGVFRRSLAVRKFVLGHEFLEGTWVGFYVHEGQNRFTVEFFDQESGDIVISGREFDATGSTRVTWDSFTAGLDVKTDRLTYAYECDIFQDKSQHQGMAVFRLRRDGKHKPAAILDGYSADLIDAKKDPNCEHKISDGRVTDKAALARAREIFADRMVAESSSGN